MQQIIYPFQWNRFSAQLTHVQRCCSSGSKRVIFDDVLSFWGSQPGETIEKNNYIIIKLCCCSQCFKSNRSKKGIERDSSLCVGLCFSVIELVSLHLIMMRLSHFSAQEPFSRNGIDQTTTKQKPKTACNILLISFSSVWFVNVCRFYNSILPTLIERAEATLCVRNAPLLCILEMTWWKKN